MPNIQKSRFELYANSKTVKEIHTDLVGIDREIVYTIKNGDDPNVTIAAHATDLGINLELAEVALNIQGVSTLGSDFTPTFIYSTVVENVAALRLAYANATKLQAVMIGDFLSGQPDIRLQNAFGLSPAQVTTLRTNKLTPAANTAALIRASLGQ